MKSATDGAPAGEPAQPVADLTSGSPACSIARALDVIGDRWSILILRDTFRGIRRFEEIRRDLGIPKAVLSERLSRLVSAGVLSRRQYMAQPALRVPPHRHGTQLSPVLVGLMDWGDRWLSDGAPPTILVHAPAAPKSISASTAGNATRISGQRRSPVGLAPVRAHRRTQPRGARVDLHRPSSPAAGRLAAPSTPRRPHEFANR
ncbi:MAG: helix-turn-helix transcriptional regulator [Microthrixaceae bacterium]|nr:helix-turn-helix transcriptional regulator [Microthrixaceae bacterium]